MFASEETLVVCFVLLLSVEEEFGASVSCSIVTVDDVEIGLHTFTFFAHIVITAVLHFLQAIAAFPGIDIVITVITFIANEPLGLIIIAGVHQTASGPPVVPANIFYKFSFVIDSHIKLMPKLCK